MSMEKEEDVNSGNVDGTVLVGLVTIATKMVTKTVAEREMCWAMSM